MKTMLIVSSLLSAALACPPAMATDAVDLPSREYRAMAPETDAPPPLRGRRHRDDVCRPVPAAPSQSLAGPTWRDECIGDGA